MFHSDRLFFEGINANKLMGITMPKYNSLAISNNTHWIYCQSTYRMETFQYIEKKYVYSVLILKVGIQKIAITSEEMISLF